MAGHDLDEGPAAEGVDRAACCALCEKEPACVAAVLSGGADAPAYACWLKGDVAPRTRKAGVSLCVVTPRRDPAAVPKRAVPERWRAPLPVLESITGRRPARDIFEPFYLAQIELVFHDS